MAEQHHNNLQLKTDVSWLSLKPKNVKTYFFLS